MAIARLRIEDEQARILTGAWMTAALSRQERIPSLAELLSASRAPERLSHRQREVQFGMLTEWMGVKARPLSDAAKRALERLRARDGS